MVLITRRTMMSFALLLLGTACFALPAAAQAKTIRVAATGSTSAIQAAVTAASPGDTIVVAPGTYKGATVNVAKDDIALKGSTAAVIDASGNDFGITVGTQTDFSPGPVCPGYSVSNFTISGLTVRNAGETGLLLFGVDGFRVTGGDYVNNAEYGIFPRCSRDGLIDHNFGSGGEDALIYVGVDDNITVEKNKVSNSVLGIELENTQNSFVRGNKLTNNVVGIFVIVLPNLPTDSTDHAIIEGNVAHKNNLPNPFPPVCSPTYAPPGCTTTLEDDLQLLPSGSGIINVGGHDVLMRRNVVTNNNTAGIGAAFNPIVEVSSDNTIVTGNTAQQNGKNPDPRAAGAGDLYYQDDPANGSCFTNNVHKTEFFPFGPPLCF